MVGFSSTSANRPARDGFPKGRSGLYPFFQVEGRTVPTPVKELSLPAKALGDYLDGIHIWRSKTSANRSKNGARARGFVLRKMLPEDGRGGQKASSEDQNKSLTRLMAQYPEVQLATLVDEAPAGDKWVHEIKFDGYRLLGFVAGGESRLRTRNGNDWTGVFRPSPRR